jgi:hypothetical protein
MTFAGFILFGRGDGIVGGFVPAFVPFFLIFCLLTFMGVWDGLIRRHVRFTYRLLSTDLHLRGVPAIIVGLISLVVLLFLIRLASQQFRLAAQACGGDWNCLAWTLLTPLISNWVTVFVVLLFLIGFIGWALSIRDMQGPYLIYPAAPGVLFSEREIVKRVQHGIGIAGLAPISSDTIVRAASEIRWRAVMVGLYRAREADISSDQFRHNLLNAYTHANFESLAKLSNQQRQIVISEVVEYLRKFRARGLNAYPWNPHAEIW